MASILESIKSTLLPAPEDASGALHTPDLSSAPGGYKPDDEPSGMAAAASSDPFDKATSATLDTSANQSGPMRAPHLLAAERQDSLDALSTKAVKNEPIEHSEPEGISSRLEALQSDDDFSSTPAPNSGLHPQVASKINRDFNKYNHLDSTLVPHPEGYPGAFDTSGRKIHESTDSKPGSFGIMGGAHLNSSDNRAETAGMGFDEEPEIREPDQVVQMAGAGILEPGPALTRLPPTEPESSIPTPTLGGGAGVCSGGGEKLSSSYSNSNLENSQSSFSLPQEDNSEYSSISKNGLSSGEGPTTAAKIGSQDPTLDLDPRRTLAQTEKIAEKDAAAAAAASSNDDGSNGTHKVKVPLGDKIKGLVTEIKGVVKKDPEIKEHGKALRTGNA